MYRQVGDGPAFGQVLAHFEILRRAIAEENGTFVKTIGDAVMAVFPRPVCALRAMNNAQRQLGTGTNGVPALQLKVGMHHGPCIAVSLDDRLDYFGSVVNMAARLASQSTGTASWSQLRCLMTQRSRSWLLTWAARRRSWPTSKALNSQRSAGVSRSPLAERAPLRRRC